MRKAGLTEQLSVGAYLVVFQLFICFSNTE